MPDIGGSGTPGRSQIEGWDTAHLETAATRWSATAGQWEDHFSVIQAGTVSPGGTVWEGMGADAAQDRAFADLVKVRGLADSLHSASAVARNGADELAWAKSQALSAIIEAEEAQFAVAEDLSVTDRSMIPLLPAAHEARLAQAQVLAAQIHVQAQHLAAADQIVAADITAALAPLSEVAFDEAPDSRDHPNNVDAVDYHHVKEAPPPKDPNPKDPHETDPNRSRDGTYGPGNSGDGKAAEKAALDERERRTQIPINRQQVLATHPNVINPKTGKPQGRYYDGLEPTGIPDQYIGIEAKTSEKVVPPPEQQRFDAAVSPQSPATATLNGRKIEIIDAQTAYPPQGWEPPSAQAPQSIAPGAASPGATGVLPPPVVPTDDGAPPIPELGSNPLPNWGTHIPPEEAAKGGGDIGNLGKVLESFFPPDPRDPNNTA